MGAARHFDDNFEHGEYVILDVTLTENVEARNGLGIVLLWNFSRHRLFRSADSRIKRQTPVPLNAFRVFQSSSRLDLENLRRYLGNVNAIHGRAHGPARSYQRARARAHECPIGIARTRVCASHR